MYTCICYSYNYKQQAFNLTMRRTAFQGRAAWMGGCGGGGGGSGDVAGSSLCCHTTLGCAMSARRWPVMRPLEAGTDPVRPPAGSHACNTHTSRCQCSAGYQLEWIALLNFIP
jgi:hypothetical protein